MNAADTEAQAAAWLIRLEADPSLHTLAQFRAWLGSDTRRRATYLRLEHSWQRAQCLRRLQPLDGAVKPDLLGSVQSHQPWSERALQT